MEPWTTLGLNMGITLMMIKGALPPVIALQSTSEMPFAAYFSTLGYSVAISW